MTLRSLTLTAIVVLFSAAAVASPPSYLVQPVFFEMHPNAYGEPENIELLPQGEVYLRPFGTESVEDFDWVNHRRKDRSWWNRMENFFYLAPLLASGDREQRALVNEWFEAWYEAHKNDARPNQGAFDGMTVGQRAMILSWMLKLECSDPIESQIFPEKIFDSLAAAQRFLVERKHFEDKSNHGMWQALGLLETARAVPNDSVETIALDRLLELTDKSVSKQGIHKEHSPNYHFIFMRWLGQFVPYLESIYRDNPQVAELRVYYDQMVKAAPYLVDHNQRIPPIGDSSERIVEEDLGDVGERLIVDKPAGFAIYKDRSGDESQRYLVLNIQNKTFFPQLPFHYHDDVLGLFYNDDGEIVLGDAGRYSYARSGERDFVRSPAGHNTIVTVRRGEYPPTTSRVTRVADEIEHSVQDGVYQVSVATTGKRISRALTVSKDLPGFVVNDTFLPREHAQNLILWSMGSGVDSLQETGKGTWRIRTISGRHFALGVTFTPDWLKGVRFEVVEGKRRPRLGWRAEGFEKLLPTQTIVIRVPRGDVTTITTTLRPAD